MKNRVTLLLSDIPFAALRMMKAEENKSMSLIVEEFIMGDRQVKAVEKKKEE